MASAGWMSADAARKLELEGGALGILYDAPPGRYGGLPIIAPTSLPGTFRRFAEWCEKAEWGTVPSS